MKICSNFTTRLYALSMTMIVIATIFVFPVSATSPSISYHTHVQNVGWQEWKSNGQSAGTTGQGLRVEAIEIKTSGVSGGVIYRTHVQNVGWQEWKSNGQSAGTTGQGLQVEAIEIKLTGVLESYYDVMYRTHVQNIGWQEWKSNGQSAGTTGQSLQVEAIEIKLVAKSSVSSSGSSSTVTKYVVTSNTNNNLNMRSSPSTSSSIVAKLSYGTQVQVLSTTGSWSKVSASGKTGYVSSQYLSATNPKTDSGANISNGLHAPIANGAKFSKKTSDNGWYGYHDINRNVSSNTPVYAITDGTAYFYQYNTNGRLRSYGNYVKFVSSDGQYEVRYAHLSCFNGMRTPITADSAYPCSGAASDGYVGAMKVSAGTTLGWVGTTGNSSGTHLHIEVYKNGVRVDPTSLFPNLV